MFATIFLAILIALGGGTAAAAENAAPGDALYPFKIHVNESVRGVLAVSDNAEADWQSTRAVRRLEEAASLAAEGRLDVETRDALQARFLAHQKKAEELLAKLTAKGNTEAAAAVSAHIEANLASFQNVLTVLQRSRSTTTDMLVNIRAEVKAGMNQATTTRAKVEATLNAKTEEAAEGRMKAAENKIEEVSKYIENKKVDVDAAVIAQARAQLKLAKEKLAQGKVNLEQKQYADAFVKFQSAHILAQEAKMTLKTLHKLNISLLRNVEDKDDDGDKDKKDEKTVTTTTGGTVTSSINATGSVKTDVKIKVLPVHLKSKNVLDVKVRGDDDERDND